MTMNTDQVVAKYVDELEEVYSDGSSSIVYAGILRAFYAEMQSARDGWSFEECRDWVHANCEHLRAERKVIPAIKLLRAVHHYDTRCTLGLKDAKDAVYAAWGLL